MGRVDRKDVKDTAFDIVLRGYDKRQVDERLRFLSSQLTAAENALRAAEQRATMLEDSLSEARSAPGGEPPGHKDQMSLPNFGARVEKILKLAQDEAQEVRQEVDSARQEVDRARQEVERESERVRSEARAEADQLIVQARAEAERLVSVATDAAQQRERSSAHELHQLSRLHDEINADLYRAKEVLDGLFGSTGAAPGAILPKRRQGNGAHPHQARTV